MADTQEWEAARVRGLAVKLADPDLPAVERDRVQRMLIGACQRLAERNGLDARALYWAALGQAEPERS